MQYDPPSPYMGGPPQRKSRTQGESDHDSRPDSNQKTTGVQDDDRGIPIPIRQFLARQEVGKFDFGREFGIIKNQDEFKHRLEEYEAMNNDPKSCTDFPTDPKTRMEFALKIGKAIVNVDRASDATNKNTVAQRKPEEVQNEHNRDDEKPGGHKGSTAHSEPPKDTASDAVNHLNRLKTTEVEIMSWKIMIAAYNAQRGELCRGTWGRVDIKPTEDFSSWRERIEAIIEALNTSKVVSRTLFLTGQTYLEGLVASPRSTLNKRNIYQRYTAKRSAKNAKMKEESRLAASRKHNSPRLPTPRRAPTPDFADCLAKKIVGAYRSPHARDGTEREFSSAFSSPSAQKAPSAVLKPSSSGWRKGVPTVHNDSESSLVTTGGGTKSAGLSPHGLMGTPNQRTVSGPGGKGFLGVAQPGSHDRNTTTTTQNTPSTQRLLRSSPRRPLPSSAPGASRAPKRQRRHSTLGGNGSSALDIEREEDDDEDED